MVKKKKKKKTLCNGNKTTISAIGKNEKIVFLTCPGRKIYRVEAAGLKSSNNSLKNYDQVFVNMWHLGQIVKKNNILSMNA